MSDFFLNLIDFHQKFQFFVEKFKPGKPGNFREMPGKHPGNSWILDLIFFGQLLEKNVVTFTEFVVSRFPGFPASRLPDFPASRVHMVIMWHLNYDN